MRWLSASSADSSPSLLQACCAGAAAGLACVATKLYLDVQLLRYPTEYVELSTGKKQREHRPVSDVIFHVLLFKWRVIGDGYLFQLYLGSINEKFQSWDVPFIEQGLDPKTEVVSFCKHWGVSLSNWVWSKKPGEYKTMNEWFTRCYDEEHSPENNVGEADIVTPATAVVTWFESAAAMPKVLKNDEFTIDNVGIPEHERFLQGPAAIFYLAPADYHCYHAPIAGKITCCKLLDQERYSVTVKPYVFRTVNILRRNRRAVIVVEGRGITIALVIVGGVTVDSIRLEKSIQVGSVVQKGQRLGCFARGGSSIALLCSGTSGSVQLASAAAAKAVAAGLDFKLEVGRSLADA